MSPPTAKAEMQRPALCCRECRLITTLWHLVVNHDHNAPVIRTAPGTGKEVCGTRSLMQLTCNNTATNQNCHSNAAAPGPLLVEPARTCTPKASQCKTLHNAEGWMATGTT